MQNATLNSILANKNAVGLHESRLQHTRWVAGLVDNRNPEELLSLYSDEKVNRIGPLKELALLISCCALIAPTMLPLADYSSPRITNEPINARTVCKIPTNPFADVLARIEKPHVGDGQTALLKLVLQIETMSDLEYGWDGFDAPPISRLVVNDAVTFLKSIPSDMTLPDVSPAPENKILMMWEKGSSYLIASVLGDSLFHAYANINGQTTKLKEIPIDLTAFPSNMKSLIQELC